MPKTWTKTIEHVGVKIRLFERAGSIYRDVTLGRTVSASGKARTEHDIKSLKHADRKLAERQAKALAESLAEARLTGRTSGKLTLGQLFAAYRQHKLPSLTPARAREAEARMSMFVDAWGRGFDVLDLSQAHVDRYCAMRRSLDVVSPGLKLDEDGNRPVGYREPKPVRDGALHGELSWLSTCLNFATRHKSGGRRLLPENPLRGIDWPKEKNPRRPIASDDRFSRTIAHADDVDPVGRLRCILALARYTGRRESAICGLRAGDLLLSRDRVGAALAAEGMDERLVDHMPHGAIRWSPETDKEGFLFVSPINAAARAALDAYLRQNPRVGDVPLFPAPGPRQKKGQERQREEVPMRRETAAKWLVKAERAAGLPKLVGGVFHPYRRLWATERKGLAEADVAAAGGWKDTRSLKQSYQQADGRTVLRVVENIA
jgi:integrase